MPPSPIRWSSLYGPIRVPGPSISRRTDGDPSARFADGRYAGARSTSLLRARRRIVEGEVEAARPASVRIDSLPD